MALLHGDKWAYMSDAEKVEHLDDLCGSQNTALDMMQKERNQLLVDVKVLEVSVQNAEAAFYGQKTIVKQLIDQKEAVDRDYQKRIEELIAQVEVCGGNID